MREGFGGGVRCAARARRSRPGAALPAAVDSGGLAAREAAVAVCVAAATAVDDRPSLVLVPLPGEADSAAAAPAGVVADVEVVVVDFGAAVTAGLEPSPAWRRWRVPSVFRVGSGSRRRGPGVEVEAALAAPAGATSSSSPPSS